MNDLLQALKTELADAIAYQANARDIDLGYSKSYAHTSLVELHSPAMSEHETKTARDRAAKSAFYHEGRSKGHDAAIYSLVQVQKRLIELEQAYIAAQPVDPIPSP